MTTWALLGSGEFEPWSEVADRWLLERATGDGRVAILPTASSREGDEVFDEWGRKGAEHFASLGVEAEVVPVRTRSDADRSDLAERLRDASVAYLSGGNPAHLADVLRSTAVCDALLTGLARGMGYAGCSAGVACLTETTYDSDSEDLETIFRPGLGIVHGVLFGPHWDMLDTWVPGSTEFIVSSVVDGQVLVGIDEKTAMLGDGHRWLVRGRGRVRVRRDGEFTDHRDGDGFELPLAIGS
ncbi:MAG: Type 1 glutamine amidotransferase-like domain-containing protein [Actinomycetota bacterium]